MVLVGLGTRCRLATWPTSRSPFLLIATTLGVVRLPSLLAMISGLPDCITAIALLVVPKSIPIIFAITQLLLRGSRHHAAPDKIGRRHEDYEKGWLRNHLDKIDF